MSTGVITYCKRFFRFFSDRSPPLNTMPDIMHNNANELNQAELSHHHCHEMSYDSPRHCQHDENTAVNTTTTNSVSENYEPCVQHYFDVVGASNCVNLVPCTTYITPVTVGNSIETAPPPSSSNTSTSTFGKPQVRDVTYMSTSGAACITGQQQPPRSNQSLVTVNDGLCTVSVCDEPKLYDTYGTVKKL